MRRVALLLVILALTPACSRQELTLLAEGDLPQDVYGPPLPPPEPEEIPANGTVYFISTRHLAPTSVRLQPVFDSQAEALLVSLFLPGPEGEDTFSEIPEGTRLNKVEVAGGIATVDVSGDFERAAPPRSQALRIAQVVFTLTEPGTGITSVRFQIDGVPQEAIGGEQLGTIPGPVSREDYRRFAPGREQSRQARD
ncbi:MAG: GerMN domain-containing protein [Actinomycetota bacterium]